MANSYEVTRTNYFRITDEEKYSELFSKLLGEDVRDITKKDGKGRTLHCICAYSGIGYKSEDCVLDIDAFLEKLQKILPEDDAFILVDIYHENLNAVGGYAVTCTSKDIRWLYLEDYAVSTAREMLGDPEWKTSLYC